MKRAKRVEPLKSKVPRPGWAGRLHEVRLPLAICGLTFLVYSRSLFCGFVRDDIPQIVNNRQVQSWEYLPQLLGSHLWSQQAGGSETMLFYRPLFSVWMLLMHTLGGLAPWFWHLSNILLHVVATYLVFRLCQRLTENDWGAAAAAVIFAVNPIHVDAVSWVSASCELLFAIFTLAAMLVLVKNEKAGYPRVWISALLFSAGLLGKETGVVMLAILPIFAWVQLKGYLTGGKRVWMAGYPYVAVTACYLLIRWAVMHRVGVETGEHNWAEVIFSSPSILLFYVTKLLFPWKLSGCYVNPLTASPNAMFWLQLTGILVILAAVAWYSIRFRSLVGLAAALIVIPILPALAVVRIYPQGDMTHDRYLYLPSVGLSLLIAMLVKQIWSHDKFAKVATSAAMAAVVLLFSAETIAQQRYYQDDVAFYSRVIEISPSDAYVRGMFGNLYLDQRRVDLALEQFRMANHIAPDNQKVTLFLARGLFLAGQNREAESVLAKLLQTPGLDPKRQKSARLSLANVEISLGNFAYGQQLLSQVEGSDDKFPELHWAWGVLYQKQGLLSQALAEYQKEFEITGDALAQQRSASISRLIYLQSSGHSPTQVTSH